MLMEEKWLYRFSEVVRHVDKGINAIKEDKVTLDPFAQREVFGFWELPMAVHPSLSS